MFADAKAAGIHPLYAIGANTASYTPTTVVDGMGPAWANAGQDISRAIYQSSDGPTREASKQLSALQLERAGLENDLLRAQIGKLVGQVGPPVPTGAQSLGEYSLKPAEVTTSRPGFPQITAGPASPAYTETEFGPFKMNLFSPTVSEQLEDMELLKYYLLYKGNQDQITDYISRAGEPVFGPVYQAQTSIENAIDDLRSWAEARRKQYRNAKNRSFNQRSGSWGREAR